MQVALTRGGFPPTSRPGLRLLVASDLLAANHSAHGWDRPLPGPHERRIDRVGVSSQASCLHLLQ